MGLAHSLLVFFWRSVRAGAYDGQALTVTIFRFVCVFSVAYHHTFRIIAREFAI